MGAVKRIPKDWRSAGSRGKSGRLRDTSPINIEAKTSDELPELLTAKEVAVKLRCHYKTIEELRKKGVMKFMKLGSRFYTTPAWVAEYIEVESRR